VRIVIVGGGQIGSSLARTLALDHEVVVIDLDRAVADTFSSVDVEFIVGSGTSDDVLRRAVVESAQFFVACTGLDEVPCWWFFAPRRGGRADGRLTARRQRRLSVT